MMFLIRTAFWLSVVILLLPGGPQTDDQAPRVTLFEAVSAAGAAVSDMSGFCRRNPDACTTGGAALRLFAEKVRNGVRMVFEYFHKDDAPAVDNGTLKEEDIEPPWRGPKDKAA